MRNLLCTTLGPVLLGAVLPALAQGGAPPTAVQVPAPTRAGPSDPEQTVLYRQLDLAHYRRTREHHEEILDRLWTMGSPNYCRGLARLGDDYRLDKESAQALDWYRRAVRECSDSGWAVLSVAEIAVGNRGSCPQAQAMLADRRGQTESRLPFPAAEAPWTPAELDYLGVVGTAMIDLACATGTLGTAELQEMVEYRGRRSFGVQAYRLEPYVQARIRADLYGRVGRADEARRSLGQAVQQVCRLPGADQALVDATPRERDTPLAFHIDLGAAGLLRDLWEQEMLDDLSPDDGRCIQELLHSLRRQFRFDPAMDRPEVRDWYVDLDRRLRQSRP